MRILQQGAEGHAGSKRMWFFKKENIYEYTVVEIYLEMWNKDFLRAELPFEFLIVSSAEVTQ